MNSRNRCTGMILGVAALLLSSAITADGMPPVPADYPSHKNVGACNEKLLRERLQHYNETRLQLADVLRGLADEPKTAQLAKTRLLGYADNLDGMRTHMPPPNPDSTEFRNFDFQLGITLTSMTLFLNTEDEHLAQRFIRDRDNPNSELGIYLARLDDSRKQYMDRLESPGAGNCRG